MMPMYNTVWSSNPNLNDYFLLLPSSPSYSLWSIVQEETTTAAAATATEVPDSLPASTTVDSTTVEETATTAAAAAPDTSTSGNNEAVTSTKEKQTGEATANNQAATDEATASTAKDDAALSDAAPASASTAPTTGGGDPSYKSKRVYVGNLAWEVSWQDLKDHAKEAGLDVSIANVMSTADGRSKGCGIVEFHTVADAQQAVLLLNDTELRGRQIFVREDREEQKRGGAAAVGGGSGGASSTTGGAGGGGAASGGQLYPSDEQAKGRRVYVGNLSWDVAWQDLKDHMREAGEVVHAEVIREHTGRSKGCGIVEFASEEDAQNAITTLTDTELKGRMIFVREDREIGNQAVGGSVASGATSGGGGGGGASGASGGGSRGHQNTSVYVWNLAPETSWQDLKDHMRKAGNVDSATILTNAQGESLGCGVVAYQRPQEAVRAIRELQDSELHGQIINVREDRVQGGGGGRGFARGGSGGRGRSGGGRGTGRGGRGRGSGAESQVYVGNLSPETTWRELKDHFRQCGEVSHAEVKISYSGQSKGFGIISFSNREDANTAITRLNGSNLQGSELEVRFDQRSR